MIPGTSREASGPGVGSGSTGGGISPPTAAVSPARRSRRKRPIPPPTTASAASAPAWTRNPRREGAAPEVEGTPMPAVPSASRARPASRRRSRTAIPASACTVPDPIARMPLPCGSRSAATTPIATSATMPATARPRRRRARSPSPAPTRSTMPRTPRLRASLSFCPNRPTTTSFAPGGWRSMTVEPTAVTGDGAPGRSPATSSPTASAAPAATRPARAASGQGARRWARGVEPAVMRIPSLVLMDGMVPHPDDIRVTSGGHGRKPPATRGPRPPPSAPPRWCERDRDTQQRYRDGEP